MAARQKTDLLHPLTTWTWEHCRIPPWKEWWYPTHVTTLHGTVAVLTSGIMGPDILFLSSTNLQSWTHINLQYEAMSLTTYQSMLVLVGGTSHKPTNKLLTSTTGKQWTPSLPPMPTMRYATSSVSTRSPEVLVIAGGRGSNHEELDVVEVLQGDEWLMVDPLPAPAFAMSSTLHDGELCFLRLGPQDNIVFTCSCTSLISLCSKSSRNSSIDRPLWQKFQAPRERNTTIVSCFLRQVFIDGRGKVRGYSSMTQSGLAVTSTGPTPDKDGSTAATVLNTGELILAHQFGGVYRGTVSVSLFSPDRRFLSEDLTRLEAVMGVQIVSVLASHVSQLASLSGVMPLPKPQSQSEKYVEELISQWCAGLSSVSPTWKHLLEVITGVGLPELRAEIEAFMKGQPELRTEIEAFMKGQPELRTEIEAFMKAKESKYKNAYRHFISTKKTLEMLFLKFLFSGPPRVGKTTALRRLMGEIADLISAREANRVHASTGAVESGSNVIVKSVSSCTAVVTKAEWCAAKSHTDEARMLFLQLEQIMETEDAPPTTTTTTTTTTPAEDEVATRTMGEATAATPTTTPHQPLQRASKPRQPTPSSNPTPPTADIPLIAELFKKASEQPEFMKDMQHHFRAFLRMEDSGGQPELMDMLPALTIGPGLYLVFFNLQWNLKKEFKVIYQHPSGKTTTPEESKITLEEMLLSTLSSISCSSASANLLNDKEANSSDLREILESSKSVAYLVGTHKDKVTEELISRFDEDLQSIIRGTDFFDKKLVKFCSEGKLIVAMDNMKGGVEEVKAIREMLDSAMERHFKPLRIPAVWLLFNLCLAHTKKRTASMKTVLELSSQFNMSTEETKVALWFLHHHAGVMMYFPNVPLLQDLVILDAQVVYDSVTFLYNGAMSFKNVGQACFEKFRETGQFVLKDLIAAMSCISGEDIIPPEKLIALLEFLHIIAPIPRVQGSQSSTQEQEAVYLMPCILRIASKEKLDAICHDQSRPQCVAPLMIRYKCGFVPLGIFPALIAGLIVNRSFRLVEKGMMKNKVQFRYQPLKTLVSFLCYPRFYAIVISELTVSSEREVHKECVVIRQQVVAALEQVGSHMNYGYFRDYQFAFECPSHPGKEHLCVVEEQSEVTKLMECLEYLKDRKPEKMGGVHTVWWHESQSQSPDLAVARSKRASSTEYSVKDLKCSKIMRLFRDTFPCSEAKKLGTFLDISYSKIQDLSHNNTGNVDGFMMDILNYWLETDPEKSWSKLAEAVEDCGYRDLAEKIRQMSSQ